MNSDHKIRLLDTGFLTGAENMALDGIILENTARGNSPPTMRFLQFKAPVVLVGYNQEISSEVRMDYCKEQNIEVNRRHTGGGAILFDQSMLGVELFLPTGSMGFRGDFVSLVDRLGNIFAEAVSSLGVRAGFRPRNDIEIKGKKVSGMGLAYITDGLMFQGTLLIRNCLDTMLKALKIPVEKLQRREIRSLMQRVTFLEDELGRLPSFIEIKEAFKETFSKRLSIETIPDGLTETEEKNLADSIEYYRTDDWINRKRKNGKNSIDECLLRGKSGRLQTTLWIDPKRKTIKQALVTGDFFTRPNRFVYDLESAIKGESIKPEKLESTLNRFFSSYDGEFVGVEEEEIKRTILETGQKGVLPWKGFSYDDLNRLHPVASSINLKNFSRPTHLLLPYCAKDLKCPVRHEDACERCGLCPIGDMYELAINVGLTPISISNFEHLMDVLSGLKTVGSDGYVASCCEAFLAKHQAEMEKAGPAGIIVDLNSLTCYDLGKEENAYKGRYDRQSSIDCDLLAKTAKFLIDRIEGEKSVSLSA